MTPALILAMPLPPELRFNLWIALALLAVVGVSVFVFSWQVRRWTSHRSWHVLSDFARESGFAMTRQDREPPPPLERLPASRMTVSLQSKTTNVFQLETLGGNAVETPRWYVLVRDVPAMAWPVTGLRPAHAKASLLDLFSMMSYPRLGETERFVVFGVDSTAAALLSKSQARALLPPDIGLLLAGTHLVLDFSTRPFDPIELGRMNALAEQLVTHLPSAG
jgi:hypothetical protein